MTVASCDTKRIPEFENQIRLQTAPYSPWWNPGVLVVRVNSLSTMHQNSSPLHSADLTKSVPKFCRHEIVEDGIDGRVHVRHRPAEVEYIEILLDTQVLNRLCGRRDVPGQKDPKGHQTQEEGEYDSPKHENQLASGPVTECLTALEENKTPRWCKTELFYQTKSQQTITHLESRIRHQVNGYDRIEYE